MAAGGAAWTSVSGVCRIRCSSFCNLTPITPFLTASHPLWLFLASAITVPPFLSQQSLSPGQNALRLCVCVPARAHTHTHMHAHTHTPSWSHPPPPALLPNPHEDTGHFYLSNYSRLIFIAQRKGPWKQVLWCLSVGDTHLMSAIGHRARGLCCLQRTALPPGAEAEISSHPPPPLP